MFNMIVSNMHCYNVTPLLKLENMTDAISRFLYIPDLDAVTEDLSLHIITKCMTNSSTLLD